MLATATRVALAVVTLLCAQWPTATAAAGSLQVISHGPATQIGAQQLVVLSPSLNRQFLIEVMAPHSPKLHPAHAFPAVYALDGGYGVAGVVGRALGATGVAGNAYVISVGYAPDQYGQRNHDLLWRPTRFMGAQVGGGGAAFARFLLEELRPFIEARYPVDPRQAILVGNSASGLFGANMLAHHPGAFQGYVLASPSFWLQPEAMLLMGKARGSGELVFIGVGAKEEERMTASARDLAEALRGRFEVETRTYSGANHNAFYTRMLLDALPLALPSRQTQQAPPHVLLTEAAARPYVGAYRLENGSTIHLKVLDGFLTAEAPGLGRAGFITEGGGRFYAVGLDTRLTVEGAKLRLEMPGAVLNGVRHD